MNTGHRGTLATIHASSAPEAIHRFAMLAIRGTANISPAIAESEIHRCIDLVVFIQRDQGRRYVEDVLTVFREI